MRAPVSWHHLLIDQQSLLLMAGISGSYRYNYLPSKQTDTEHCEQSYIKVCSETRGLLVFNL